MTYELAYNDRGEPFGVPSEVTGWRVYELRGTRGRPKMRFARGARQGKPLIVPVASTHLQLRDVAGSGPFKLEPVDESGKSVKGVEHAVTGPLSDDNEPLPDDNNGDDSGDGDDDAPIGPSFVPSPVLRPSTSQDALICHLVTANTRVMERTIGQFTSVMTGVSEMLTVMHRIALSPPAPQVPLAAAAPIQAPEPAVAEPQTAAGFMGEMLQFAVKEAINKAIPLIFEKLTSGGGLGIPLEALVDWRKAAKPAEAPTPPAPSAPSWSPQPAPSAPSWSPQPAPSAPSWSASQPPSNPARPTAPPPATAPAGAAPNPPIPVGAAPAVRPSLITPSLQSQEDAATMLNARVLQVWQGLEPAERARAAQLVGRLTPDERAAWLAELAQLTLPEAIARARAVLHGPPIQPASLITAPPPPEPKEPTS